MSITTILQTFRRPEYLAEQIEAVKKQSVASNALIIVNNDGLPYKDASDFRQFIPDDAITVNLFPNQRYHARFAIGLLAKTEYVAFFDDDTIPGEFWYENCLKTIERHDCICVTNGRIVDRANKRQHGPGWSNPSDTEVLVDFGGHAWFMKTDTLRYMWYEKIHEYQNGEDVMLSANALRFGNIPTYVPPHPVSDKRWWGSGDKAMQYGCDKHASWIVNAQTHNNERYALFDTYVEKGWKLILENK